jgi:hypothetical protein
MYIYINIHTHAHAHTHKHTLHVCTCPYLVCTRSIRALLDELRDEFGPLLHRIKERVLAAVLAQRRLHLFRFGVVERIFPVLRGAGGVSVYC